MASTRARCLVLLPALLWAAQVFAQARPDPVPVDARRGYLRHVEGMGVTVDGRPLQLAAGATIRDQRNLIVVPVSLPPQGIWADFILDRDGRIFRAWLLTPQELALPRQRFGG